MLFWAHPDRTGTASHPVLASTPTLHSQKMGLGRGPETSNRYKCPPSNLLDISCAMTSKCILNRLKVSSNNKCRGEDRTMCTPSSLQN